MSMVYNEMLNKKKQAEKMAEMGKHRYEYDSDEDTEVIQNAVHVIKEEQKRVPPLGKM